MKKKSIKSEKLPKAPLTEVVFEIRWSLQHAEGAPISVLSDPGILPLQEKFTKEAKKLGFGSIKDMVPPQMQIAGYGIMRRFYLSENQAFPLMQIGPGILATNDSSQYEWTAFKDLVIQGITVLLKSYPKLEFFPLKPSYFELRYIDAFDKSLIGKSALFEFVEEGTSLKFVLPKFLNDDKIFRSAAAGRFLFQRSLIKWKESTFMVDLASGKNSSNQDDLIRMETKIVTTGPGIPKLVSHKKFISDVNKWLEFAHGITSPFFKDFVSKKVMDKFK